MNPTYRPDYLYGNNSNVPIIQSTPPQDPRVNVAYAEIAQLQKRATELEATRVNQTYQINTLQSQLLAEVKARQELQTLVEELVRDMTRGVDTDD